MLWWIPLAGAAAWAVKELCDWGTERERRRCQQIEWRRTALRGSSDVAARHEAKRLLLSMIEAAKAERSGIQESVRRLHAERSRLFEVLEGLGTGQADREKRKALWDAVHFFDDTVDEKRAVAHKYSVFIDEAYRRKEEMFQCDASSYRASWAKSLTQAEFFASTDVPIRGRVVRGVVHAPIKGLWFQLDAGISGNLSPGEVPPSLIAGTVVSLFIDQVHYRDMQAVVSIQRAAFVLGWAAGQRCWHGLVSKSDYHGCCVDLGGVDAFVPASQGGHREIGAEVDVDVLEVEDKLRRVIGSLPEGSRLGHPLPGSSGAQGSVKPLP